MREDTSTYWRALATVAVVSALGNAAVTIAFIIAMTPESWTERVLPALGWAVVLTALNLLLVLASTVWLRRRARSSRWRLALLAFVGPAAAWVLLGLVIGAWLFPLYAGYGLGAGVVAGVVFALPRTSAKHP